MKYLFTAFFLISIASVAQTLPSVGLVIQYDMLTTGGGGTTLTDLSGNGHNGTLTGTTTNAQGRIFNGTTDFITLPQLIGNSDFTAMVVIQPVSGGSYTATGSGSIWSEADGTSNCGAANCIRFTVSNTIPSTIFGTGGSASTSVTPPYRFPDFDVWTMSRQASQLNWGMISRYGSQSSPALQTVKFGATTTVATSNAAMGTVIKTGGNINFFQGTIAYFVLYNRHLSTHEQTSVYNFMAAQVLSRPVFLHPFPVLPASTLPVWQRMGAVLNNTFGNAQPCGEPSVIFDNNLQLISTSSGFGFKMLCSADSALGMWYSESPDGLAWTSRTSAAVISAGQRGTWLRNGNTYYAVVEERPATAFDIYTSSNGITWTLNTASIITTAAGWEATNIDNPSIVFNSALTPPWYIAYEATPGNSCGPGEVGGATSTNGTTWTKNPVNPMTGCPGDPFPEPTCYGPDLHYINGQWYLWCGNFKALKRFRSPIFNDLWIWDQQHASIVEASPNETNQIGDPSLVQGPCPTSINATPGAQCVFAYYVPSDQSGKFTGINLAIANMPFTRLVTTSEGAKTDWP